MNIKLTKKTIFFVLLAIWVILWGYAIAREIPEKLHGFKIAWGLSSEEKDKHPIGLYEFIIYCKSKIPPGKKVSLRGEVRRYQAARIEYYLYPLKFSSQGEYIIIFNGEPLKDRNYALIYRYGENKYLYKKSEETE